MSHLQKSLIALSDKTRLSIAQVNFKAHGQISKGFDLMQANRMLFTIEPVNYSNGDRWKLSGIMGGVHYFKNMRAVCKYVNSLPIDYNAQHRSGYINNNPIILHKPIN